MIYFRNCVFLIQFICCIALRKLCIPVIPLSFTEDYQKIELKWSDHYHDVCNNSNAAIPKHLCDKYIFVRFFITIAVIVHAIFLYRYQTGMIVSAQ